MAMKIELTCDGCHKTATADVPRRKFVSITGRGYGFGHFEHPTIESTIEPTGWVHSDPYTGCTYCPECWNKIESGEAA